MGFCRWLCCGCSACCQKKKDDSEEEAEPTAEEIRAQEIEEAEREAAERQATRARKGKVITDDDEDDAESSSDEEEQNETLEVFDENVTENYCSHWEFKRIMKAQKDKVFMTEIFNLVDEANQTPEHCLFNWGRPRRWHVDIRNISAENISDQMLPEVFFHISIGGTNHLVECIVQDQKDTLYQLGTRGMTLRTTSRKHWTPGEIQVFQESFTNEKHISSYEGISVQCMRIEMWMLPGFG